MSGNVRFLKCFSFCCCFLFAGIYQSLHADSSSSQTDVSKSRQKPVTAVSVIASRLPAFKEKIENVPSNVTYKNKEDLKEIQPLTFQDAVADIEGATFFDSVGNGWDTSFGLRGFSGSGNISFLLDGVRINEVDGNTMNFPLIVMSDVESIQVERGSASPLYGNNAFAGVVNLTTGQPSEKPLKLFGGTEWDSFQGLRFNQGFSGTLQDKLTPIGGKFKYYFNGGRNTGEGWRNNTQFRITSFDIKMSYELPEKQGRFYVGLKHVANSISAPGEMMFQQYQDYMERNNKPLDGRQFKNTIIQIGADKKFWDDHVTASILSSWRPNRILFYTTSGTFTDVSGGFNPDTDLVATASRDHDLIGQIQYENQWREIFNRSQVGMEFRNQREDAQRFDAFQGHVVTNSPLETDRRAEPYNMALFWRETLIFFDKVIPYAGMRHDFHWLNTSDHLNPTQDISRRWHKSTVSTGLTVKPVKFADLFLDYSQGFRVPSISDINPFNGAIYTTNLQPVKSDSYETGFRLRYHDLAKYKFSFFLIDLKNEIINDRQAASAQNPFGQNINIGKSRRYGIEQRMDWNPVQELKFYGSYSWVRANVRETSSDNSPVDGRSLAQFPENRFALGSVVMPLARFGDPYEGLKIRLSGVVTGRQHPQSYETTSQGTLNTTGGAGHFIKGYSVWDFMLSYEWKEKMIYFKISNVFDEKYYSRAVSAFSGGTQIYPGGTFTFVNPGASREYVLGTRWEFA